MKGWTDEYLQECLKNEDETANSNPAIKSDPGNLPGAEYLEELLLVARRGWDVLDQDARRIEAFLAFDEFLRIAEKFKLEGD